mgnify:CR=1 FL=1
MTQLQSARKGVVTDAMKVVAEDEGVDVEVVRAKIATGEAVIPLNIHHKNAKPIGVGRMFKTKINANLGRSVTHSGKGDELDKLEVALKAGADFVMDLSVGSDDLKSIRQGMLEKSDRPLGTVPVYETVSRLEGDIPKMNPEFLLEVIRAQAEQGGDFMTLHAGLLRKHIPLAMKRKMGIVSRGGAIMAEWMMENRCENPLYTHWDEVLDILVEHDVTVSLGDGLRPGCLADASDDAQFGELDVLGELVERCRAKGVQVMVEGPGHVPFDQIRMNMERQQEVCRKAPFYVLGPVVTDIAPGYDHITSAIGGTLAAVSGADFLCYVTPAEHLGLPDIEDVREGVIASKIAAHAADLARGNKEAWAWDNAMALARKNLDWEKQLSLAIDPVKAREYRLKKNKTGEEACSMCGEYCAVKIVGKYLEEHKKK